MSMILDDLKARLDEARSRLILVSQRHQAIGLELQQATNECNIWTAAVALETREEEKRLARANENQIRMDLPDLAEAPKVPPGPEESHSEASTPATPVNKTLRVREILRSHATGMTPSELWTVVRDEVSSRAYLYAILKRLRDNDEVSIRRGKYFIKAKPVQMNMEEVDRVVIQ